MFTHFSWWLTRLLVIRDFLLLKRSCNPVSVKFPPLSSFLYKLHRDCPVDSVRWREGFRSCDEDLRARNREHQDQHPMDGEVWGLYHRVVNEGSIGNLYRRVITTIIIVIITLMESKGFLGGFTIPQLLCRQRHTMVIGMSAYTPQKLPQANTPLHKIKLYLFHKFYFPEQLT